MVKLQLVLDLPDVRDSSGNPSSMGRKVRVDEQETMIRKLQADPAIDQYQFCLVLS